MSALVEAPLDPRTYRHLSFLLLSVPLGLAYALFLATGFGLVPGALSGFAARLLEDGDPAAFAAASLCLALGVALLPLVGPVLSASRRLIGFERRLSSRLLGGLVTTADAGPVTPPASDPWRRVLVQGGDVGLMRGLTYLLLKAPLALLSLAVVAGSVTLIAGLLFAPALYQMGSLTDLYAGFGIEERRQAWLCVLIAFPVLGLAIQAVNGLAWVARELARLLLASPDAARLPWSGSARSTAR
jgi:hypothetical protein